VGTKGNPRLSEALGDVVRELRQKKGLTQEQFTEDTGINVIRIEGGYRDVSLSTLFKISSYFNLSLKDFIGRVEKKYLGK
jgi:transcriptional regulator with XRE-family HTH domain